MIQEELDAGKNPAALRPPGSRCHSNLREQALNAASAVSFSILVALVMRQVIEIT
jgi:hypothetical protein